MKTIQNLSEFEQLINGEKPVLVDFYAEWCSTCQALLPIIESVDHDHENDLIVAKVDIDVLPELASKYGVRSIPRVFFIKNNEILDQFAGLQPRAEIDEKIKKIISA